MSQDRLEIGPLVPEEADELGSIFYDAVHRGAGASYGADQRHAWAPVPPAGAEWLNRLVLQKTVVARIGGRPVGFMTLDDDGYIDLAFVSPGHHRKGIGERLYGRVERMARDAGIPRLHSQASHPARGLFARHGWTVVRTQQVARGGVMITNALMEKHLDRNAG